MTRRACFVGRVITERNRVFAAVRNHLLRALTRLRGLDSRLQKLTWIPDARYAEGFLTAGTHRAVGWQIPQPSVTGANGADVRLDDVLGGRWTIVHTGAIPPGAQAWTGLDVPTIRISEPALVRWLRRKKAAAVVLRPDGFIYAAAESGQPLPPPPAGYTGNLVSAPIGTGASA